MAIWKLLLLALFLAISGAGAGAKVQTFSYINSGELGPYVTENGADYRVLPIGASPFQFAFYNTTPGEFYLALRMGTVRSESFFRWVWEANRGLPVRDNATFSLLPDGNLVLADADRRVVWSTSTAGKGVIGLRLLPNGNIVLYGTSGRFIWQSFDHPTDTLLVGQSLRAAGPNKLISRSPSGSYGIYSLVMEPHGLTLYVNSAGRDIPYYKPNDDGSSYFGLSPTTTSLLFQCEPTDDGAAYELNFAVNTSTGGGGSVTIARPKYNATLSFLRLETDGNLAIYTFYDPVDYRAWEKTFVFFSESAGFLSGCGLPGKCGRLGLCEDEMCMGCPTPQGVVGWSKGCRAPAPSCGRGGGGGGEYYKVAGVESFVSGYGKGEEGVVRVEECKKRCSADCHCLGFLFWERESRCWMATLLGTLTKVGNATHVAYIKTS